MGYGPMTVITFPGTDPLKALAEFNGGSNVEVVSRHEGPGYVSYEVMSDCGFVVYCCGCGANLCPGCGNRPIITMFNGLAAAYCYRPGRED